MTEKDSTPVEDHKKKEKVEIDTVPIETDQTREEQYHNYDDDEFEEFPAHDVEVLDLPKEEVNDVNVWEDNWEDENVEQDFYKQLREELQSMGKRI